MFVLAVTLKPRVRTDIKPVISQTCHAEGAIWASNTSIRVAIEHDPMTECQARRVLMRLVTACHQLRSLLAAEAVQKMSTTRLRRDS
jgi:hypothetical protein